MGRTPIHSTRPARGNVAIRRPSAEFGGGIAGIAGDVVLRRGKAADASIAAMVPMPPPDLDLPVQAAPLPYESRLQARPRTQIDLVVIHCTELPDLATAREYGERTHYAESGTG